MIKPWFFIIGTIGTAVAGQLSLKEGMRHAGQIDLSNIEKIWQVLPRVLSIPTVWIGLFLYGLSAFFWLIVLSHYDLSYAYPMLSISYILIPLLAWIVFGEQIPIMRGISIAIICIGVIILSRS